MLVVFLILTVRLVRSQNQVQVGSNRRKSTGPLQFDILPVLGKGS
jgi:hypothetical protein